MIMKNMDALFYYLLLVVGLCFSGQIAKACDADLLPETHLSFVENKGQWQEDIQFQLEMNMARLYLENNRLTYLLMDPTGIEQIHDAHHDPSLSITDIVLNCHAFHVNFGDNANEVSPVSSCLETSYRNYFIGNDPTKWAGGVGLYQQIDYYGLYNGIDMRLYGDGGHLKYDFIVAPEADVAQINLGYEGTDNVWVEDNNLHIQTSVNTIVEQQPYAYQYIADQLVEVPCFFVVVDNRVHFSFPEGYDTSEELIIDPVLFFSSYTGSTADNWGFTATFDDDGNLYAGGSSFGVGYPTTTGAFQISFAGGEPAGPFQVDMGISKFSSDGTTLIWSSYLGGGSSSDIPHSMIVSPDNELIVFGSTGSDDYPTSDDAYDTSFNGGTNVLVNNIPFSSGSDIVITKFTEDGGDIVGSTYVGGVGNDGLNTATQLRFNYADEARGEVFFDNGGNIYVASSTQSPDFPTTEGVLQEMAPGGVQDGCIVKLNPTLSNVIWGTYIGGSENDAAYSLKMDIDETLYICGGTNSTDFPVTDGAYLTTYGGGQADAWVAKFSSDGTSLLAATYLGTSAYDQSFFVDFDVDLNIYTVGQTAGDYPVSPDVYVNPNSGQYLHKLNNDLTTSIWSTTFGNGDGNPDIAPTAFLVDNCFQIYVSGWGGNVNGGVIGSTTTGLPITPDAYQSTTEGSDYYFIVLGDNASDLVYGTYFGAPSGTGEHVDGGTSRFDKAGVVYQAVCAGCGGSDLFPTTEGVWSNTNNSSNCNLGAIRFGFETAPTVADFDSPPPSCAPYTVIFQNTSVNAETYEWDFGDFGTSDEFIPVITFPNPGEYNVTLTATSPTTCNGSDVIVQTIFVLDEAAEVNITTFDFCVNSPAATFSADVPGGVWSGDGIVNETTGLFNPTAVGVGTFEVSYTVGEEGCEATTTALISVAAIPDASYTDDAGNLVDGNVYCVVTDDAVVLNPVIPGGTFSGIGITDNTFIPSDVPASLSGTPIEITYEVEVDGCPNFSIQTVSVVIPPDPTFTPQNFCPGDSPVIFDVVTPGGVWSGDGIDVASGVFNPFVLPPNTYTITYTVGEGDCTDSFTTEAIIYDIPSIEIVSTDCIDGSNEFTLALAVTGTDISGYDIGGDITATANSGDVVEVVLNGDESTYNIEVTGIDGGCFNSTTVTAPLCIACEPDAGTMPPDLQVVCAEDEVSAVSNGDAVLEEGQVLVYALHTSPTDVAGTILALNETGTFGFADLAGGEYYVEYYISAVVGFPDANGIPILDDFCTVVAPGTPVLFLAPLTIIVDEFCDWLTGEYNITAAPQGGLPQYDSTASYMVTGDFFGDLVFGESITIIIPEGLTDVFSFNLSDSYGCEPFSLNSEPFVCIKTPVELLYFRGSDAEQGNVLNWSTATELNSEYFTLYKSIDGQNFTPIATIGAAGTTQQVQLYQFIDKDATCGVSYYQLTQTDFNGNTENLGTLAITRAVEKGGIQVAPIPANSFVNITYTTVADATLSIYSITGRLVQQQSLIAEACNQQRITLNTQILKSGIYFVEIANKQERYVSKLIVE